LPRIANLARSAGWWQAYGSGEGPDRPEMDRAKGLGSAGGSAVLFFFSHQRRQMFAVLVVSANAIVLEGMNPWIPEDLLKHGQGHVLSKHLVPSKPGMIDDGGHGHPAVVHINPRIAYRKTHHRNR
jgi:hypothetical protein